MPMSNEIKRNEANARQAEHDKLTNRQKLSKLDKLGLTATKERAKLQVLIAAGEGDKITPAPVFKKQHKATAAQIVAAEDLLMQ